jgi:hypothetical protein
MFRVHGDIDLHFNFKPTTPNKNNTLAVPKFPVKNQSLLWVVSKRLAFCFLGTTVIMSFLPRKVLIAWLYVLLFFFHGETLYVHGDTVMLATCPKEPEVVGDFYNDGSRCVRDRRVITRTIEDAVCPSGYNYKANYCRKRFHAKVRPDCPIGYQFYGGKRAECHSPCPPEYSNNYGECVLKRTTLPSTFMTCNETDAEGHVQHRYGAFCCSHQLGNCPKTECIVGQAPGKFYYQDGLCQRQAQSIPRKTTPQLKLRLGEDAPPPDQQPRRCPDGLIAVRNICQEPCPQGYLPNKGSCQLYSCTFNTKLDTEVRCPEGVYKVPQSLV